MLRTRKLANIQKLLIAIVTLLPVFLGFSFSDNVIISDQESYTFIMPDSDVTLLAVSVLSDTGHNWWDNTITWHNSWTDTGTEYTGVNYTWWDIDIIHWGEWLFKFEKDKCPNGDYSSSRYDRLCWSSSKDNKNHSSANESRYDESKFNPHYSDEMNKAYQFAYHYWITTQTSIDRAIMDWNLTRISMAKMLSQYAINVLWMKPNTYRNNVFNDVSDKLDTQYDDWVTLAYQLWIMWINMPNNEFRPYDLVPRAEFVTALSRLLYNTLDWSFENTAQYYVPHMEKLVNEWIVNNPDPKMLELRWYVMLMLMRAGD